MGKAGEGEAESARGRLAAAYDRFSGRLYRHALLILADRDLAEDAVQQAFAKLAGMGARIEAVQSVEGYLRVAVRNESYRLLAGRRIDVAEAREGEGGAILKAVDGGIESEEERKGIEAALRKLPAEQREIVHLKVYEGMTFEGIGEVVGISANTAASRYRYAMAKLKEWLAKLQEDRVR